jgi:hypothetical protein
VIVIATTRHVHSLHRTSGTEPKVNALGCLHISDVSELTFSTCLDQVLPRRQWEQPPSCTQLT